jgi:hypothetical protein
MPGHLRQPLQVIINAQNVLARALRGHAAQAELALIGCAAGRVAAKVDPLIEALRLQQVSDVFSTIHPDLPPFNRNQRNERTFTARR